MLQKLKKWFSVENNVNLVRDILFVGSLLLAMILGLIMCSPVAHATEVETTTEAEDLFCLTIPSYKVGDTTYNGASLKIPYDYTDDIVVYHWDGGLYIYAVDYIGSTDGYVSVSDSGTGLSFWGCGVSELRWLHYAYSDDGFEIVHRGVNNSMESGSDEVNFGSYRTDINPVKVVYSTSNLVDMREGGVYFYASDSLASTMSGLLSFGRSVVDLWGSISDFATDNIYVFLPLLAWLLVMAAGGLLKLFKA